jgi:putative flippase GtrA
MSITAVLRNHSSTERAARRILRLSAVGAAGTVLDILLFSVLHLGLGLPSLAANTFSYCAGMVNNFLMHRNWTFADRPQRAAGPQFLQFLAIGIMALALNDFLVWRLAQPLSAFLQSGQAALAAKFAATAIGTGLTFAANNFWTFRANRLVASDRRNRV